MNLILIRGASLPIAVRPEDRAAYIRALQQAQAGRGEEAFTTLLYERLSDTLDDYLRVLEGPLSPGAAG